MAVNKISTHPCLQYADELRTICQPLNQINITYFGYAFIDKQGQFSVLNNDPHFLEHYLNKNYYNADIHLAELNQSNNYIVLDSLELTKESKSINDDAMKFGIKHIFSIVEVDQRGTHYYHFANNSQDFSINQFYINNIDLLKLFIKYFHECINSTAHLLQAYNVKFTIDDDSPGFSVNDEATTFDHLSKRNNFIKAINSVNAGISSPSLKLSPQQMKCIKLLTNGLSAKQVAHHLNLSKRTVENYLAKIRYQLGCTNSKEIIAYYHSQFKDHI